MAGGSYAAGNSGTGLTHAAHHRMRHAENDGSFAQRQSSSPREILVADPMRPAAEPRTMRPGALQAGLDTLDNPAALEFSDGSENMELQLPAGVVASMPSFNETNVSSGVIRCSRFLPSRSSFQQTSTSNFRRLASRSN